ncbi:MAG: NAD(P)/FAD-dependent oxidoreductase [Nitrospiraceae bacterium]|nr:NAD(P)/FAD-dependent oxidoreductase [Nitrospiraceae bacterium]
MAGNKDIQYDCVIVGAGPGGLQAAVYLGRYCRSVLVLDRGGGRTLHAKEIENFLGQPLISGRELIETGISQALRFGARIEKKTVSAVAKGPGEGVFRIETTDGAFFTGRFAIVSTGARDNLPRIKDLQKFFAKNFFTCLDCDGYRMRGKKTVILGNSESALRLALAVKQMYTNRVTVALAGYEPPPGYREALENEGIEVIFDEPEGLLGEAELEAAQFKSGRRVACHVVLSNYGYTLNDSFLAGLGLKRNPSGKYETNRHFESSMRGLYMVGPLAGNDQAVIAAGEGAEAAIDINKRLVELNMAGGL